MSIAAFSIERRAVVYFATFLVIVAGFSAFFTLGQLEDPEFTVKTAVIVTPYPGASPEQVELEVSDRIETKIQELKQINYIESFSRAGLSQVKVEISPTYWADALPQVWDEMRRKVREVENLLPPGAGRPQIYDDYGDVFGFQLALIGDGFDYAELERYAKDLRKELSVVKGVGRVDLWGAQDKVVYVDVNQTQISQLGLSAENFIATLKQQNTVVDAGSLNLQSKRYRIAPSGWFQTPEDIGDLAIRPTLSDTLQADGRTGVASGSTELIRIRDIGTVRPGYREPPSKLMRYNGRSAIGISITNISGVNIVEVGQAIDARVDELAPRLPVGIEIFRVHWQSDVVAAAVDGFVINFLEAVAIVLLVLTVVMGWRMGVIIGTALVVTVLGSFILMALFGIDLQRMSLGALVIALGMMVDNAIVVADGIAVRIQQGMDRKRAAVEAATRPSIPLLGATVIAVMAFYPIAASPESTGEYCLSLFTVVGITLLFSWIVSLTLTPLQCIDMLPAPESGMEAVDPYATGFYQRFRAFLERAIRARWFSLGLVGALLIASIIGFGYVTQLFFPASSMPKFMIDFFAPEGTRIETVAAELEKLEKKLLTDKRVESVTAYLGSGPPRFYLPVEPEDANQAYGQLIVNMHDYRDVTSLIAELTPWVKQTYPDVLVPLREYGVGPGRTWKFEARLSGPAVADPNLLRAYAAKYVEILNNNPNAAYARTDWRQRVHRVVPEYSQARARWANVTRDDLANTTKLAYDGLQVGLYRKDDDLIPIVARHVEEERLNVGGMPMLQIQPSMSTDVVPLSQVTEGIITEWEDPIIRRRDRRRTIKIQSNPVQGVTLPTLLDSVAADFAAVELPPGYKIEWSGEIEDTADSQAALVPGMLPAVVIMAFIIVALYNAFRPLMIIVLTIPLVMIGITAGLLAFNTPFGFMSLLGSMSLAGMMIKNIIVLLDQIEQDIAAGKTRYQAIVDSAVSRLRPVALAAATTVLGVIPLLQDVFWVGMAVAIMAGLSFGTVLTMVIVPVFYALLYKVPSPGGPDVMESAAQPA